MSIGFRSGKNLGARAAVAPAPQAMKSPSPSDLARTAVCLTVLGAGMAACAKPAEPANSWTQSLAYAEDLQATLEAVDYDRSPLWGDREDGLAFEGYGEAVELLLPAGDDEAPDSLELTNIFMRGWDARSGAGVGYQTEADAFLALPRVQAALAAFRRGAHRGDARPAIDWSAPSKDIEPLLNLRALSLAAAYHADTLAASGEDVAAARWLLDVAQLGLDQLRTPLPTHSAMGMAHLGAAFFGPFYPGHSLDKLGPAGREVLLAGLDRVLEDLTASPLTAAGDFVLHMRQARELGQISQRSLSSGDGQMEERVLEGDELTAWLADRRAACEAVLEAHSRGADAGDLTGPLRSLQDSLTVVHYRLACLQLALRLDLDEGASRESWAGDLRIAATIGEEGITVGVDGAQQPKPGYNPLTIRHSVSR